MTEGFIPAHGGYRKLLSYQKAEIVYDATVHFCARFLDKRDCEEGGLRERMTRAHLAHRSRRAQR